MGQGSRAWGGDKIMINVFKDGFSQAETGGLEGALTIMPAGGRGGLAGEQWYRWQKGNRLEVCCGSTAD